MLTASLNPLSRAFLQTTLRSPKLLSYWQMWRLSLWLAAINWIANQTEAISEICNSNINTITFGAGKYQTGRIILVTNAQWMNLYSRLIAGNSRIYLQHMGTKNCLMALTQIKSIVLHEYSTVIMGHNLQQSGQGSQLPITLSTKAIAITH